MRPLTAVHGVHAVVPEGIDDPARPSGGNAYDRHVLDGLRASGWVVTEHAVTGAWPRPDAAALGRLADVVGAVPTGALLLVDGLVASCADGVLVPASERLRLVVLVHLPLGMTDPDAAAAERRVLTAAAAVVTTSAWTRERVLDAYALEADAVRVAPPGVDAAPLVRGTAEGARLLCVGALTEAKGHADLVAALGLVADLSWSCMLAGSVTREPHVVAGLCRSLAEAGLTDRVHLAGALGRADLERAYAAADLLVLPSHVETYGMVVTEALARGIPVVAAAVGGVPEALGDTASGPPGLFVPAQSPEALAGAVRAWLTDGDLRERLRRRARRRRETLLPWSRTAEQVSGVLAAVGAGEPVGGTERSHHRDVSQEGRRR